MPIDKRFFTVNQMLAGDLADAIDATVIGDRTVDILDVAPFSESKSGDLTFYSGGTQEHGLSFADRSVVITTHEVAGGLPSEVVALVVDNPRLGFAVALDMLVEDAFVGQYKPATSIDGVEFGPGVTVGQNVSIGQGSVIGAGVCLGHGLSIGRNCRIEANAVLSHCLLGDDVVVHANAVIGGQGFGFEITTDGPVKLPHVGSVKVGNGSRIGAGSCIDRGTISCTQIGANVMIDNLVHVAHNCVIEDRVVMAAQVGLAGGAHIASGAILGGQVGVSQNVRIGSNAVIMAQSGVTKDVKSGATVVGFPAEDVKAAWRERAAIRRMIARSTKKGS